MLSLHSPGTAFYRRIQVDEDLKILIPEDKFLSIGKKTFKIWISAERALRATALFNKISTAGTEEHDRIKTDLDFYNEMLDVAFLLIKQDFRITKIFDWIKRELLTKKHILKHLSVKELTTFIDEALEPIIGTKKKELARQEKASEAMMILMETISPEALAELLRNSLQGADIQKAM
jgi:hypothetical protein